MIDKKKKILGSILVGAVIGGVTIGCKWMFDRSISNYYSVIFTREVTGASVAAATNEVLDNYSSLSATLVDDSIPIFQNGNMVSQGLTLSDEYIVTSCYDSNGDNDSILVTIDKENGKLVNVCEIDNDAHVGGIAYDEENNLVWVSAEEGNVNVYDYEDVTSSYQANAKYKDLDVGKGLRNYKYPWLNSVASMCLYDNKLYVGSFQTCDNGYVKRYAIKEDKDKKRMELTFEKKFAIPNKVQGISFYKKDDETYMLLSRSFGRQMSSIIQIFKYDEMIDDYTKDVAYVYYKAPSMLEQIAVDDDMLYTIYESAAKKYSDGKESVDALYIFDLPSLTKKL